MVERMEFLQSIIDKEASANTFFYNYPPKPDYSGSHKAQEEKKAAPKKAGVAEDEEEDVSEATRIKKMYED